MCGILGYIEKNYDDLNNFQKMLNNLSHRGPDDHGVWLEKNIGLILGHKRLSILDTSEKGKQPMESASGQYVIVYNGEIYNHPILRKEIESNSNYLINNNWKSNFAKHARFYIRTFNIIDSRVKGWKGKILTNPRMKYSKYNIIKN